MKARLFIIPLLLLTLIGTSLASARSSYGVRAVANVARVEWVTGAQSPNKTDKKWDIQGTDLGVMFQYNNEIMIAFGDTYGCCKVTNGVGDHWRSNTIGWSSDRNLDDGMSIDGVVTDEIGHARSVLQPQSGDLTVIPTAGITINGRIYLHYMAVRSWDQPGQWTINRSGWAYEDSPSGPWQQPADAVWQGNSRFGQAALVDHDGYVYIFGTPSGRFGNVSLARVPRDQVLQFGDYQYWDGGQWNIDPTSTADVVKAPVGEISVAWNDYLQSWIMLYLKEDAHAIVIRTAPDLTGPWSDPTPVANAANYPALYGAYLHPWGESGDTIYFNMSQFGPYNVGLMRAQLVRE
jgi:hypothetical protein